MRVVLDSNIWVSSLLSPSGSPGTVIQAALEGRFEVFTSDRLWNEVLTAVSRDRVRGPLVAKGRWADTERVLLALRGQVTFVEASPPVGNWIPDDPADNWVIQCALTANAERIVTGDRKLLDVHSVESVTILGARQFLIELGIAAP
jgi:uncharacterized protein